MRNAELWRPSRFVMRGGRLRASLDRSDCSLASRLAVDRTAELHAQHLPRHCRGRLLDLGCGFVPLYGVYGPSVTENVCVDWPSTQHRSPCLDLTADLTARLPFLAEEFDTILLSDVLEHVPDPWLLWREMARVLRPGGKLVLNVPFLYWVHEAPHDFYRYTEFALRRFCEEAGFEVLSLETIGGVREVMADMLSKRLARKILWGKPAAVALQAVTYRIGRTRLGKRRSAKTGRSFPWGYYLVARREGSEGRPGAS